MEENGQEERVRSRRMRINWESFYPIIYICKLIATFRLSLLFKLHQMCMHSEGDKDKGESSEIGVRIYAHNSVAV